jgi:hypothetical protein
MGYAQSGISISGLNETVAGLKAMGAESELQKLNFQVGTRVGNEARSLVPVRSGALQGSIRASKSLKGVVVTAGRDPAIAYANPINWGWFYDRKNFQAKNIKPTQFMNKGASKVLPWIKENYINELVKIYEKFAGR